MPNDLLHPSLIDNRFGWPSGQAARLARRSQLPHYVLPNGELRISWSEVAALVQRVEMTAESVRHGTRK